MNKTGGRSAVRVIRLLEPEAPGRPMQVMGDASSSIAWPEPVGSARDSAAGELDDGYTEASGCPVREGGVSVAALHLRSGKPALAGASTAAVGSP